MKPKILFFARDYQAQLFPQLVSDQYDSVIVTYTVEEKRSILLGGHPVHECFEDYLKFGDCTLPRPDYLQSSLASDRYLGRLSLPQRQQVLAKEIAFWNHVLDKYTPRAVLNELVAIEMAEVLYIEARKRGIRYLSWLPNPINEGFFWLDNPMSGSLAPCVPPATPGRQSLDEAQAYVTHTRSKRSRPQTGIHKRSYHFVRQLYRCVRGIGTSLIATFRYPQKLHYQIHFADNAGFHFQELFSLFKMLLGTYDKLEDFTAFELVFYPLHTEPEAALLYFAEFYADQCCTIANIARCLNMNQILVVKEHPLQPGRLLLNRFKHIKNNYSNIIFLPAHVSSLDLIRASQMVITLTSSVGWESIVLGKPTFVLGKAFYDSYPCVNVISSFDQLREKIRTNSYVCPKDEATITFSANLLDVSYKGNPWPHRDMLNKENINNLVSALEVSLDSCPKN